MVVESPVGANPPDYVVAIGDREFNVEVMGIVAKRELGGVVYEEIGLFASLTRVAESLCATLEAQPWFSGVYLVHLEPVPNLQRELFGLTECCVRYARETASLECAARLQLQFHWSIEKQSNSKQLAGYSLSASEPSWGNDIQNEVTALLSEAVRRKDVKTHDRPGLWILLLLDRYHIADHSQWLLGTASLDSHRFSCIFRVHPEGACWPIAGSIDNCRSNMYL